MQPKQTNPILFWNAMDDLFPDSDKHYGVGQVVSNGTHWSTLKEKSQQKLQRLLSMIQF